MRDATLVDRAERFLLLKRQIHDLEGQADALRDEMVAELKVRSTAKLDLSGLQLTLVERTRTTWDAEKLKPLLSATTFRRVTKVVVEPAALKVELDAGRVDASEVAPASTVVPTAPYVLVKAAA